MVRRGEAEAEGRICYEAPVEQPTDLPAATGGVGPFPHAWVGSGALPGKPGSLTCC